ncbi:MAG: cytidylate kinase [Deltaproteobacteria bacterium]|nr:cytidylate kinase [Deltaproteobacteria bacterium]
MAILTLSRKLGSGSQEIGQAVAKALHYKYVDHFEIVDKMKAVGDKWGESGKIFDEEPLPKLLDRHDSSFVGYVALAQWIVLASAAKDKAVINSRGSNILLKGIPYAFRVRVTGPVEQRVERVMNREGIGRDIAQMLVNKADHEMARSIRYMYGKDWDDPAEYDAIVDTGVAAIDQIVDNLTKELAHRDGIRTKDMRKMLALRVKAYEIRAHILTNPKLYMSILDVRPEGWGIVLRGVADKAIVAERVEDMAQRLAGDIPLKIQIHSRR